MAATNLQMNVALSDYAFGVAQDEAKILELANLLAPPVVTGAKHVNYAVFNADNAYQAVNATRGLSSKATRILFGASNAKVDLTTKGLEIPLDDQEAEDAGTDAASTALQQSKVLTLVRTAYLSHLSEVVTVAQAGVTAVAGVGNWSSANVDPIAEIDKQLIAIARFRTPTSMFMDVQAWNLAKNNPNVTKRFIAAGFTLDMFAGQLVVPNLKIVLTSISFNTLGFGNAAQTKTAALGTECWITCNSPSPTLYDPSFMKTFAVSKELFGGVKEYRDDSVRSQIYSLDWHAVPAIVASNLVRRISVS
jgi:hypothetical protein